jgi:hypothetical protein
LAQLHAKSARRHWFFKTTTVFKSAAHRTSCLALSVLAARAIVTGAHQLTNAITARMVSSFREVLVILRARLVLLLTEVLSSVLLATLHARLVSTIPAHVPVASLERDSCKSLELTRSVLRNVLKALSPKMVFVKFVTSDVLSVWVLLETVLPALLEDIFIMLLVGTTAQELLMPVENVSTNAHQAISDNLIKNASSVHQNARPAATTQLA